MPALQFLPPPKSIRYARGAFPLSHAKRLVLPDHSGPATDALAQRIVDEIGTHTAAPAFLTPGDGAIECTLGATGPAQGHDHG